MTATPRCDCCGRFVSAREDQDEPGVWRHRHCAYDRAARLRAEAEARAENRRQLHAMMTEARWLRRGG